MISIQLENINPEFRQLVDLLFFSDRLDLDLSRFKFLLKKNLDDHLEYVWDRFRKSSEIYWVDGQKFWSSRLLFLLNLNEKVLTKMIEEHLEKRMVHLVTNKLDIDTNYDVEYLQFIELCKIKHDRQEDLSQIQDYLIDMPAHVTVIKLIKIVNSFIPILFKDLDDYARAITHKITRSARHFDLLLELEQHGYHFDRQPVIKLAQSLIYHHMGNDKNCRAFFYIINDPGVMAGLKQEYNAEQQKFLLDLIKFCDFRMLEDQHMLNIKNLLELDPSLAEEITAIYANKLYLRKAGHKKANADRLIRLAKTFPQIGPRKVLSYLSTHNRMTDIKYVLLSFPDLRKLAAFV